MSKKNNNLLALAVMPLVLSLGLAAAAVPAVWAQAPSGSVLSDMSKAGGNSASSAGLTSGGEMTVGEIVGRVIRGFLGLLGLIFVVLTIYAGFLWMTASGNEEQISKAKKMLTNAVIGIIIILLAYSVTAFVMSSLYSATEGGTVPPPAG